MPPMNKASNRYVIAAMYRQSAETIASMGFHKAEIYNEAGIDLDAFEPEYRLDPLEWSDRLWDAFLKRVSFSKEFGLDDFKPTQIASNKSGREARFPSFRWLLKTFISLLLSKAASATVLFPFSDMKSSQV